MIIAITERNMNNSSIMSFDDEVAAHGHEEKKRRSRQTQYKFQAIHDDKKAALVLQEFGERTSFHILGRIAEASKEKSRGSTAKSYTFLAIFFISLSWSVKSVYEIGSDYFTYPTTTNVEIRPLKEIPAITVCLSRRRLGSNFALHQVWMNKDIEQIFCVQEPYIAKPPSGKLLDEDSACFLCHAHRDQNGELREEFNKTSPLGYSLIANTPTWLNFNDVNLSSTRESDQVMFIHPRP